MSLAHVRNRRSGHAGAVCLCIGLIALSTCLQSARADGPARADARSAARAGAVLAAAAVDDSSNPLGASLYAHGVGRDGREVGGLLGGELRMRGAAVACANCHGADARGGGESFVRAPDIRWYTLSKSYGAARGGGGVRPAYDAASFARALRSGIGADGVALDPAMPRFDLADDEIAALIARLDTGTAPAAAAPALVLLLPEASEPMAEALREGLQTCPPPPASGEDGRVRRLPALRVQRYREPLQPGALELPAETAALIAPYLIGREQAFADALPAQAPPVLLPITLFDAQWRTPPRHALPGLEAQAHALLDSIDALRAQTPAPILAIHADRGHPGAAAVALRVIAAAEARGWRTQGWSGADEDWPAEAVAVLALARLPAPPSAVDRTASGTTETGRTAHRPLAVLVPSAFMAPDAAQRWSAAGAGLRLALPYPPTPGDARRWVPPVRAWTAIGCELIAQLPEWPADVAGLPEWRRQLEAMPMLSLAPWLAVPAQEDTAAAARRVVLIDWTP